jgi:tellurite resistance protein TerC
LAESVRHRNHETMRLEVGLAGWVITICLIVGLLVLDLGLAAARPHMPGFRETIAWSLF